MEKEKSSFRDPSGYLFTKNGILYRSIAESYRKHYEHAENSGLYASLIKENLLVPHKEVDRHSVGDEDAYKVIVPEKIPFISYPYEWCFDELKDAALLTLQIQKKALECGMTLRDASAFNVQFLKGQPIFIDTLSFKKYEEGTPWIGYRQFCEHFLAPLMLMSLKDVRLNRMFRVFIDGIPLDLASALLPRWTYLVPRIALHIHLHAKSKKRFKKKDLKSSWRVSRHGLLAIIESLEAAVKKTSLKKQNTEWANYYNETNYTSESFQDKKKIISEFLEKASPQTVWDIGANTGEFSRLASDRGIETIAFDIDPAAVQKNYLEIKRKNEKNITPLMFDVANPSPSIGWMNEERMSLEKRGPADLVMALALIHHLAISNNIPLAKIAEAFSRLGRHVIVEFVPKSDSRMKRLLKTREDIFPNYHEAAFEKEFSKHFVILEKRSILNSERTLYRMKKK